MTLDINETRNKLKQIAGLKNTPRDAGIRPRSEVERLLVMLCERHGLVPVYQGELD